MVLISRIPLHASRHRPHRRVVLWSVLVLLAALSIEKAGAAAPTAAASPKAPEQTEREPTYFKTNGRKPEGWDANFLNQHDDGENRLEQVNRLHPDTSIDSSKDKGSPDCTASRQIGDGQKYNNCGVTNAIVTGAQVTAAAGQFGGAAIASSMGQGVQNNATQSGSQSQLYQQSGEMAESVGKYQVGLGAVEIGLGVAALMRGRTHKKAEDDIIKIKKQTEEAARNGTVNQSGSINLQNLNSQPRGSVPGGPETNSKNPHYAAAQLGITKDALKEQQDMKAKAKEGATTALIAGVRDLAAGLTNMKTGKDAQEVAQEMKKAEEGAAAALDAMAGNLSSAFPTPIPSGSPIGDPVPGAEISGALPTSPGSGFGPPTSLALNGKPVVGSADGSTDGAVDSSGNPSAGLSLGQPFDTSSPEKSSGGDASKLGEIAEVKGGAGSGGGGGGGFAPGGLTSAGNDAANAAEAQAKPIDSRGAANYDSGGGSSGSSGGGGRPDSGPDLSGLLGMLKQPGEKEEKPGNNSLEFGGRGPASGDGFDGTASFLDKNVNIFERVHLTYQEKHKAGAVGI